MGYAKKVKGREFTFKLAIALGKTVEEIENTMTHSELQEWGEYVAEYPLPADVSEIQMATLSFLISITNGGKKSKSNISDFIVSGKNAKQTSASRSVLDMSADELDRLAGV